METDRNGERKTETDTQRRRRRQGKKKKDLHHTAGQTETVRSGQTREEVGEEETERQTNSAGR